MSKELLDELYSLKNFVESDEFQKFIMKPIFEELDKQKNAYDCESLRELAIVKGKKQGLMFLIKLLKGIELQIKNEKFDIEQSEEK
jgi:hypothetical protein